MPPPALLDAATELVRRVLLLQQPADREVADFFRASRSLGVRERQVLADTAYAVLRRWPLLCFLASTGAGAGAGAGNLNRRLAALVWQGDPAIPRAALSDDECRWLAQAERIDVDTLDKSLRHNLPPWFAERMQVLLGDEFWPWVRSIDQPASLDLRVNTTKTNRKDLLARLRGDGVDAAPTPYSPIGIRVGGKPSLTKLAAFEHGDFEVQDEGSQLLALLTGARRGEMVVDFCAGGGGKTLALGALMRGTGRLYAFDTSGHRLAAMQPRLQRSGLGTVYPIQIAHERDERISRLAGKADRVLVDAPCTGLGTLRRHPDLKWRQSAESLAAFGKTQPQILAAAAALVKSGGRLVYATCSPLVEENEAVASQFDAAHVTRFQRLAALDLLRKARVDDAPSLLSGDAMRLWTHRHGTDGFFAAVWQRSESDA